MISSQHGLLDLLRICLPTTTFSMNPNELIASLLRACHYTIRGRIARDPETKFFDSGTMVCNASMAVNKPGAKKGDGQDPDWFKVAVWGKEAQQFADTVKKGDLVEVFGRVKSESWVNREGEQRTQWVITADKFSVIPTGDRQAAAPAQQKAPASSGGGIDESEMPF